VPPVSAEAVDESARAEARDVLRSAKRAIKQGRPHDGVADLRRAVALDPTLPGAQVLLGQGLVHQSDVLVGTRTRDHELLAEAVTVLTRAVELAPEDAGAEYWLGQALSLGERKEDAVAHFERALALDPEHGEARKNLGVVLGELGRDEEALTQLERAVELLPDDAGAWMQYGYQLELSEDLQGARAAYERSLAIDWAVPGPYSRLATVLRRLGDADGGQAAVAAFRAWSEYGTEARALLGAAKADRTDPGAVIGLVEIQLRGALHARAVAWLERALAAHPDHPRLTELLEIARAGAPDAADGSRFRMPRASEGEPE
jgi:tetratricopeptide (TPR) repeat protein